MTREAEHALIVSLWLNCGPVEEAGQGRHKLTTEERALLRAVLDRWREQDDDAGVPVEPHPESPRCTCTLTSGRHELECAMWGSEPRTLPVNDSGFTTTDALRAKYCFVAKAPLGWYCTREIGHDGPCAAVEFP